MNGPTLHSRYHAVEGEVSRRTLERRPCWRGKLAGRSAQNTLEGTASGRRRQRTGGRRVDGLALTDLDGDLPRLGFFFLRQVECQHAMFELG